MTSQRTQQTQPTGADLPLRVSTLELFFDLVFVFTITQLTGILARDMSLVGALHVLLIFVVLWWMYDGYVWLSNSKTLSRSPERLLMLLGMTGFLIMGLAIPDTFADGGSGRDAVALGVGYLIVVAVHTTLYQRINRNIMRVAPFNVASALLITGAGLIKSWPAYVLWAAALALLVFSPLLIPVRGLFDIQPAHFAERHGSLIIVVFGESVADIGIGAAGERVTVSLAVSAALGLALVAALWWVFFGTGDDERAAEALMRTDAQERPQLALAGYFYAYIPMVLGVVAIAAGLKHAIGHAAATLPAGPSLALAGGVALFLAGDILFRYEMGIGVPRYRAGAAVLALAAWPVAVAVNAAAAIALLAALVAAALVAETLPARGGDPPNPPDPALRSSP